jgi:hypothetical protein
MRNWFVAAPVVFSIAFLVALPAAAQWTTPPYPPGINPNGGYVMQGVGNIYEQYQKQQQAIQDLKPKRDLWEIDQRRKQQWLEQQNARRQMQQQQQQYARSWGIANSTPPTAPPVSQAYQRQKAQEWQRQSQTRQQALQQRNMRPLPQWGTATSTRQR